MAINKRDLIRFIGDGLYSYYKRGALVVLPTYDLGKIDETTELPKIIKEFFIKPYEELLEYRDKLPEASLERVQFENKYPKLEYELGEVANLISGFIKDYISRLNQAQVEKEMLSTMHIDEKTRAVIQEQLATFGKVEKRG